MNKKAQTEDMTELVFSMIVIFVGVFVLNFASIKYDKEIAGTSVSTLKLEGRESLSIEGMMNHETKAEGKKQKIIELIGKHEKNGKYEKEIENGISEYLTITRSTTCFNIKIQGTDIEAANCQIKQENKEREEAIIPLPKGEYKKITMEYGEIIGYIIK